MPVKRWMPRPSGSPTPTSELQRSCSSPPPTSTAPTSVSSQRSRASPFVSVSSAMNSAVASGWASRVAGGHPDHWVIRLAPDGLQGRLQAPGARPPPCGYIPPRAEDPEESERPCSAAGAVCALAGCGGGGDDYANKPRPATPINVTAAITRQEDLDLAEGVRRRAGRDHRLQPDRQRADVTLQTEELGGSQPGIKQSTDPIAPRGTGTLKADVREGSYALSVGDGPAPATVEVGAERKSAQDTLLAAVMRRPRPSPWPPPVSPSPPPAPALAEQTATQRFFSERLQADKGTSTRDQGPAAHPPGLRRPHASTFRDLTGDEPRRRRRARAVRRRRRARSRSTSSPPTPASRTAA